MLFQNCDNLSKTLQLSTISAAESQDIVKLGLTTLRNKNWWKLWAILDKSDKWCSRRRGWSTLSSSQKKSSYTFWSTSKALFRAFYFEALDLIANCIVDRFSQKDYQIYTQIETLVMATANDMPLNQLLNLADLSINLDLFSNSFDLRKEERRKLTLIDILNHLQLSSWSNYFCDASHKHQ